MCIIMASITKLQLLDALFTVGKDYDQDILDINNQIDTINGNISNINNTLNNKSDITHNHDDRYYSESEIDSKLNTKANNSHTHDDRYFTETEINSKLNSKANTNHAHDDRYYTESEVNNLLNRKVTNNNFLSEQFSGFSNAGQINAGQWVRLNSTKLTLNGEVFILSGTIRIQDPTSVNYVKMHINNANRDNPLVEAQTTFYAPSAINEYNLSHSVIGRFSGDYYIWVYLYRQATLMAELMSTRLY